MAFDSNLFTHIFTVYLDELKEDLLNFATECNNTVRGWYKVEANCAAKDVAALIERLDEHLLPNIVPDMTLLGTCAPFTAILNAAAIYRFKLLTEGDINKAEALSHQTRVIERLTEKAFEASFVQREYKTWKKAQVDDEHSK